MTQSIEQVDALHLHDNSCLELIDLSATPEECVFSSGVRSIYLSGVPVQAYLSGVPVSVWPA